MRIENPINWLKSKRAISDNPISWFSPQNHYKKFEQTISTLNDRQLVQERARYNHTNRNSVVVTGLALAVEFAVVPIVGPEVGSTVLALSCGPGVAAACLLGANRGIIRNEERNILQSEMDKRGLEPSGTIYLAQQAV